MIICNIIYYIDFECTLIHQHIINLFFWSNSQTWNLRNSDAIYRPNRWTLNVHMLLCFPIAFQINHVVYTVHVTCYIVFFKDTDIYIVMIQFPCNHLEVPIKSNCGASACNAMLYGVSIAGRWWDHGWCRKVPESDFGMTQRLVSTKCYQTNSVWWPNQIKQIRRNQFGSIDGTWRHMAYDYVSLFQLRYRNGQHLALECQRRR